MELINRLEADGIVVGFKPDDKFETFLKREDFMIAKNALGGSSPGLSVCDALKALNVEAIKRTVLVIPRMNYRWMLYEPFMTMEERGLPGLVYGIGGSKSFINLHERFLRDRGLSMVKEDLDAFNNHNYDISLPVIDKNTVITLSLKMLYPDGSAGSHAVFIFVNVDRKEVTFFDPTIRENDYNEYFNYYIQFFKGYAFLRSPFGVNKLQGLSSDAYFSVDDYCQSWCFMMACLYYQNSNMQTSKILEIVSDVDIKYSRELMLLYCYHGSKLVKSDNQILYEARSKATRTLDSIYTIVEISYKVPFPAIFNMYNKVIEYLYDRVVNAPSEIEVLHTWKLSVDLSNYLVKVINRPDQTNMVVEFWYQEDEVKDLPRGIWLDLVGLVLECRTSL